MGTTPPPPRNAAPHLAAPHAAAPVPLPPRFTTPPAATPLPPALRSPHLPQVSQPPPPGGVNPPPGVRPLPPAPNALFAGKPVLPAPKSRPAPSPPKQPPLPTVPQPQLAAVPPVQQNLAEAPAAPIPKLSSPLLPSPSPLAPPSAPGSARVVASPALQEGTPVGAPGILSPMIDGKSAPATPVSARSLPAVEFVPPTEYFDVSRIKIRFVQLIFLCELFFHLCTIPYSMHYLEMFFMFKKTFSAVMSKASLVAPVALILAAILATRTIYGIFAINFTTPANITLTTKRLIAFAFAHIFYGVILMVAGNIFKTVAHSDKTHEIIKTNLAHLILNATREHSYMEEINRLQQKFQCCGMKTNAELDNGTYTTPDHPWNMWFSAYTLDETYPSVIRELYSLPWSCCNLTFGTKCEHIGISRYLRRFYTPTDFNDVETSLQVQELKWNPTSFEHYADRNELAIATLYNRDCAEEAFRGLGEEADLIKELMFNAGITVIIFSIPLCAVIIHLRFVVRSSLGAGNTGLTASQSAERSK